MSRKPSGGSLVLTRRQSDGAGYLFNTSEDTETEEADILCCPHCQQVIKLQEWKLDREQGGGIKGGYCRQCRAPICPGCTDRMILYGCEPYLKKIDEELERSYRIQQNRKMMGI